MNAIQGRSTIVISDAAVEYLHRELGKMPLFQTRCPRITPVDNRFDVSFADINIGDLVCTVRGLYVIMKKEYKACAAGMMLDYDGKLYVTQDHYNSHASFQSN